MRWSKKPWMIWCLRRQGRRDIYLGEVSDLAFLSIVHTILYRMQGAENHFDNLSLTSYAILLKYNLLKYILVKYDLVKGMKLCLLEEKMSLVFLKIHTESRDFR